MNVALKCLIPWKHSIHASSWRLYLHCGIEETGSPGIICIVCHQVLCHPSGHGTSSMGKHLFTEAHITKSNQMTQSEVTELINLMGDNTALAILN